MASPRKTTGSRVVRKKTSIAGASGSKKSAAAVAKPKRLPDLIAENKSMATQSRDDIRLSFLIHDVSRMRRAAYDQFMKPLGITRAQWWVLAHLSRDDGMMQTQLADVLEVGKASLGDVIGSLEAGGWVERKSDPTDKRAKRVFLTQPAQSLIKRMTAMEVRFNNRVFGQLSAAERGKLFEMMQVIKRSISQLANSKELVDET